MDYDSDLFLSEMFLDINHSIHGLRRMRNYEMNYLNDFSREESRILSQIAEKMARIPKGHPLSLKYLDWEFRDKMVSLGLATRLDSGQHVLSGSFWRLCYEPEESPQK